MSRDATPDNDPDDTIDTPSVSPSPAVNAPSATSPSPPPPPPSPQPRRSARAREYFTRFPPKEWTLPKFTEYCQGIDQSWTAFNIKGFWKQTLEQLGKQGDTKEKRRAGTLLKQLDRTKHTKFVEVSGVNVVYNKGSNSQNVQVSGGTVNSKIESPPQASSSGDPLSSNIPSIIEPESPESSTANQDILPNETAKIEWPPSLYPTSSLIFSDGTLIQEWAKKLSPSASKDQPQIVDVHPDSLAALYYPKEHTEICARIPEIPPLSPSAQYCLQRFRDSPGKTWVDYVLITEQSPRPPGELPTPLNYHATYINRSISHLLTIIDTFSDAHPIYANAKEGYLDVIWGFFIDSLWHGGTCCGLYPARKEILTYIPSLPYRYDGVFRYLDASISFDLGVAEASISASNINNDTKGEHDLQKIRKAMRGMLAILVRLVRFNWDVVTKLQVFGFITSGWTLCVYRMSMVTPEIVVMQKYGPFQIPLNVRRLEEVLKMLECLTKVQMAMYDTLELVLSKTQPVTP